MSDFKTAFGYNIGIIDLKTLLTIAVTIVYDEKTFDISELNRLEGFANATFNYTAALRLNFTGIDSIHSRINIAGSADSTFMI